MTISTTDTILNELKEELETTISGAGNYMSTLSYVGRGVVNWEETDGRRPYVWFVATEEDLEELMGGSARGELLIELHGYIDYKSNNDNLHKLLRDVKYYLYNDCSYYVYIDKVIIHEGGVHQQQHMSGFLISCRIPYEYTTTNI